MRINKNCEPDEFPLVRSESIAPYGESFFGHSKRHTGSLHFHFICRDYWSDVDMDTVLDETISEGLDQL